MLCCGELTSHAYIIFNQFMIYPNFSSSILNTPLDRLATSAYSSTILDYLPEWICCFTTDGTLTFVNQAYSQHCQTTMEQLVGQNFFALLPESDRASLEQRVQSLSEKGSSTTYECSAAASDGSVYKQTWLILAVQDADGNLVEFQAMGQAQSDRSSYFNGLDQGEHYRQAVDQSPNPIFSLNRHGQVQTCNLACKTLLHYDTDVLGKPFRSLLIEDIRDTVDQLLVQVFRGESISGVELVYPCRDGQEYCMISRIYPLRDQLGNIQGCVVANTDIRDRKEMEESLRQSEARFRAIFQQNRVGMNRAALNGQFLEVNPAFCHLLGYTEAELLSLTHYQITHPEEQEIERELCRQLNNQYIPYYTLEKRYIKKTGEICWVNISVSVILNDDNRPLFSVAVIENIHERKQMEAALQQSQQRYQMAIAAGDVGVWDWHLASGEIYLDPHLKSMLGYADQDIQNTIEDWTRYVHPDDRPMVEAAVQAALAGTTPTFHVEHRMLHRDGGIRWFLARGHVSRDRHGQPQQLMGTDTDITQRKQTELQIRYQVQREQGLNHVIRTIRQSLDLDTIFATATHAIGALLPANHVQIWQCLIAQGYWKNRVDHRRHPDLFDGSTLEIALDHPLSQRLLQQRFMRVDHPEQDYPALATAFPGAWMLFLLDLDGDHQSDRHTWGALTLTKDPTLGGWEPAEVELAQIIADQVAIAIQQSDLIVRVQQLNSTLENTVHQRTAQLNQSLEFEALLKRITDKVRDSLDESAILQTAVDELSTIMQTLSCDAALYDLTERTSTIIYESAESSLPSSQGMIIVMADHEDYYQHLLQGDPLHYCTLDLVRGLERRPNYATTALAQPLIDDQGVIGDLWIYREAHLPFSAIEIRLVQQVANQCAIAIRQSRLYQATKRQVQELERLNHLKDDFLSTVSHELRSPMASINMATQMLEIVLEQQQVSDRRIDQYLRILREQCNQELALINDLLDLQHLETGTQLLDLVPVKLEEWIPHIAESLEVRIQAGQQILHIDVPEKLPTVSSDPTSLTRILVELLSNACKYTPPFHQITVRVRAQTSTWELEVQNSGVEIAPDEQSRVFEKFYRITRADRWQHGGTGLGLALVKRLTEHLGGTIRLSSQDQLTCFYLTFPIHPRSTYSA
ncbi:MAG: PAS domain S-box protein [Leptolyngbya sp. DLM2.Bin15]|nr:MAG: PAS domain S-box protein [Leptolyngbya sp. DLM2.Bin15]